MKKILILGIILPFLIMNVPSESFGLSCEGISLEKDFEQSDIVFTGKVISSEYISPFSNELVYEFVSYEVYKGPQQETILIYQNDHYWNLSKYVENYTYVIFANNYEDKYTIPLCGRSSIATLDFVDKIRELNGTNLSEKIPSHSELDDLPKELTDEDIKLIREAKANIQAEEDIRSQFRIIALYILAIGAVISLIWTIRRQKKIALLKKIGIGIGIFIAGIFLAFLTLIVILFF